MQEVQALKKKNFELLRFRRPLSQHECGNDAFAELEAKLPDPRCVSQGAAPTLNAASWENFCTTSQSDKGLEWIVAVVNRSRDALQKVRDSPDARKHYAKLLSKLPTTLNSSSSSMIF